MEVTDNLPLSPENLEDLIEKGIIKIGERYKSIFFTLRSFGTFVYVWMVISFPLLWFLTLGIFYKLSENLLEDLASGREPYPKLSFEDVVESLGYSFLLIPVFLFWFSPSLVALCLIFTTLRSLGFYFKGVAILIFLAIFLLPFILGIQIFGLLGLPISLLRFLEERDFRYSLAFSEVLSDMEVLKEDFWAVFSLILGDLLFISLPLVPLVLVFWRIFPIEISLLASYLVSTAVLSLIFIRAVMEFSRRYSQKFLELL